MPDQKQNQNQNQNQNPKQGENKNAQPSFPGADRKDAGGIDDVQEGEEQGQEGVERQDRAEEGKGRVAGGARQPESQKPESFDKGFGAERKS